MALTELENFRDVCKKKAKIKERFHLSKVQTFIFQREKLGSGNLRIFYSWEINHREIKFAQWNDIELKRCIEVVYDLWPRKDI